MDRKTMIGIAAGSLVVVGLGIAGLRHAVPDPDEAAGAAQLHALGDRIPAADPPGPSPQLPLSGADNSGVGAAAVQAGRPTASAVAVQRLKVPPTKQAMRAEKQRIARERAIAEGRLPQFEAREKAQADRQAKKKAEREKRREAVKKRREDRKKEIEKARKLGENPPPPSFGKSRGAAK